MSRSYTGTDLDAEERRMCDLARQFAEERLRPGARSSRPSPSPRRARALTHAAARVVEGSGEAARRYSSMAKLEASEAAMEVAREAVQVFGGYGYMREYPVERLFRDAKVTEIYEGTSEIQRSIIGDQLFREKGLET